MHADPLAIRMATESTRRNLTQPPHEPRPHKPRRAVALALQAAAHRLDPYVAPSPQRAGRTAAG